MIHLTREAVIDSEGVEQAIIMTVTDNPRLPPAIIVLSAEAAMEVATQLMFLAAQLDPHLVDGHHG